MNLTAVLWCAAFVLFLIVEAAAPGLVSIWFAAGALAAFISALLGAAIWLQFVWFFVISVALLVATKPLAEKYVNRKAKPTNADMIIGKTCPVVEKIDNLSSSGAVSIDGKVWTARSEDAGVIETGTLVTILRIEGVKVIVK